MGLCQSQGHKGSHKLQNNDSPRNTDENKFSNKVFSITDYNNISPVKEEDKLSKINFLVKLSNFRLRNVKENSYFFAIVNFPISAKEVKTFTTKLSPGPYVKYNLKEELNINFTFEDLVNLQFQLIIFEIPKSLSANKYKSLEVYSQTNRPYSVLNIDLLTLVIGPEHHDIQLNNGNNKVGRAIFDTVFTHLSNIYIEFKNVTCTVNNLTKKDVCLRAKLTTPNDSITTSDYTYPIVNQKIDVANKLILYHWIRSNSDTLTISKNNSSISEILTSTLKLLICDTKLETYSTRTDFSKLSNFITEINEEKFIHKPTDVLGTAFFNITSLLLENSDAMVKQSSKFFKQGSSFYKDNSKSGGVGGQSFKETNNNNINNPITDKASVNDQEKSELKFSISHSIEKNFCEDIYSKNKNIGKIEGRIEIKNIPVIRQIICGVHTENGFDLASHYLTYISEHNSSVKNQDLGKELNFLKTETNKLMIKLTEKTVLTSVQGTKDRNNRIIEHMNQILKTLEYTIKDSCLFYDYKSIEEMMISHEIFISLGKNLVEILDSLELEHRILAMKILQTILNRAEFDLSTITLHLHNKEFPFEKRFSTIKNFLEFMNDLTKLALEKFGQKVKDVPTQKFVEMILAFSYFRSVKFRDAFLNAVSKNCNFKFVSHEDGHNLIPKHRRFSKLNYSEMGRYSEFKGEGLFEIQENNEISGKKQEIVNIETEKIEDLTNINKSSEADEKEDIDPDEYINPIFSTVDWEGLFYNKLYLINKDQNSNSIHPEIQGALDKIDAALELPDWQNRMNNRGNGFFCLIQQLEEYIKKKIVVNRYIDWSDIPGFETIIFIIIHELKTKNVGSYPKSLINVLCCFLNNSILTNIFFKTIVINTNVNDTNSVTNLFTILNQFMQESEKTVTLIKTNFNYLLLKQCFIIVFEFDHSICVSKLLWFLYENSHLMNDEYLLDILYHTFLEERFYKLFFHWCWQVRHIFYHYILYTLLVRLPLKDKTNSLSNLKSIRESLSSVGPIKNNHSVDKLEPHRLKTIQNFILNKLEEIDLIEEFINDRALNHTYNKEFSPYEFDKMKNVKLNIDENTSKYVVIGMHHFNPVYKEFKQWKHNIEVKRIINLTYPDMMLADIKDDIIDYSENW